MKDSLKKPTVGIARTSFIFLTYRKHCVSVEGLTYTAEAIVCVRLSAVTSYSSLVARRSNVLMKKNMVQVLCSRVRINKINIIGLILQVKALLLLIFNALLCIGVLLACAVAGLE